MKYLLDWVDKKFAIKMETLSVQRKNKYISYLNWLKGVMVWGVLLFVGALQEYLLFLLLFSLTLC